MRIDNMELKSSSVTFRMGTLLKQSRPGNVGSTTKIKAYPPDRRLCPVTYVREYLKRTNKLRGNEKQLFISYKKPHHKVTTQTIARWLKRTLTIAGIDVTKYKAHSTRAASTSAAGNSDVPVSTILEQAGWASEKTFQVFYQKPVDTRTSFTEAVLHQARTSTGTCLSL